MSLMPDTTFKGPLACIESVPDYSVSFKLYPYMNQYHSILYSLFNVSGIGYLKDRRNKEEKKSNTAGGSTSAHDKSCWLTGTQTESFLIPILSLYSCCMNKRLK